MLYLQKYAWVYKQLPSSQQKSERPLPEGYEPPKHAFDPHYDPETGGYKVMTVRNWRTGPHIKLYDGWYPYNPAKHTITDDEGNEKAVGEILNRQGILDEPPRPETPSPSKLHEHYIDTLRTGSALLQNIAGHGLDVETEDATPQDKERVQQYVKGFEHLYQTTPSERLKASLAFLLKIDPETGKIPNLNLPDLIHSLRYAMSAPDLHFHLLDHVARKSQEGVERKIEVQKMWKDQPESLAELVEDPVREEVLESDSCSYVQFRKSKNGTRSVVKNSLLGPRPDQVRMTLSEVSVPKREACAYAVDAAVLKLGVVPETVLFKDRLDTKNVLGQIINSEDAMSKNLEDDWIDAATGEGDSSAQEYVNGECRELPYSLGEEAIKNLHRLCVFDYVVGNTDRHLGNVFADETGKFVAIDNGLAFPKKMSDFQGIRMEPYERLLDAVHASKDKKKAKRLYLEFRPSLKEKIRLADEKKLHEIMKSFGLEEEAKLAIVRLRHLLKTGMIPENYKDMQPGFEEELQSLDVTILGARKPTTSVVGGIATSQITPS